MLDLEGVPAPLKGCLKYKDYLIEEDDPWVNPKER